MHPNLSLLKLKTPMKPVKSVQNFIKFSILRITTALNVQSNTNDYWILSLRIFILKIHLKNYSFLEEWRFLSIKDCVLYEWKIAGSFILKDWKNQAFFSVNLIQSRVLEQNPLKRKVWAYWRPTRGVWGCPPDKVIREIKNWETENRTKSQF